jgi:type II secretory pathway component PulC
MIARYKVSEEPLRTERLAELFAVAALVLLLVLIVFQSLRLTTLAPPEPRMPSADSMQVSQLQGAAATVASAGDTIRARPLFWQSRRPIAVVKAAPSAARPKAQTQSGNIDNVKLLGVFGAGDSAGIIALVKGKKQRVMVGDSVEGWKLEKVELDRAVFRKAGIGREVKLNRKTVALASGN